MTKKCVAIYQFEAGKWWKLSLSNIVEADEIIVGGNFKIEVNNKEIYNTLNT